MSSWVSFWDLPSSSIFLLSVPASLASERNTEGGYTKWEWTVFRVFYTFTHSLGKKCRVFISNNNVKGATERLFSLTPTCCCVLQWAEVNTPAELPVFVRVFSCRIPDTISNVVLYNCPTALSRRNHCFSNITFLEEEHTEKPQNQRVCIDLSQMNQVRWKRSSCCYVS